MSLCHASGYPSQPLLKERPARRITGSTVRTGTSPAPPRASGAGATGGGICCRGVVRTDARSLSSQFRDCQGLGSLGWAGVGWVWRGGGLERERGLARVFRVCEL